MTTNKQSKQLYRSQQILHLKAKTDSYPFHLIVNYLSQIDKIGHRDAAVPPTPQIQRSDDSTHANTADKVFATTKTYPFESY